MKPVVFRRAPSSASTKTAIAAANRVAASKRIVERKGLRGGGTSQNASSARRGAKDTLSLDLSTDEYKHDTVSRSFAQALQKARLSKRLNQKALGQMINEKPAVIASYESGKAIPNGVVINKLNRALGTSLPSARSAAKKNGRPR